MNITSNLAIILCTYNSAKFLTEQLMSFDAQSFRDWSLFVYDDGSTDNTESLIKEHQKADTIHHINWTVNNKNRGFVHNFLNGICSANVDKFQFYALADQDDIWCDTKLERAVACFKNVSVEMPALYCSRTQLIDKNGRTIGFSPLFTKKPSFMNALVQSIAGGNTMVFNKAARELIVSAAKDMTVDVVSHDWFIYQLISGAGGQVYYDALPSVLYRQHDHNLIGSNNGFMARLARVRKLFNGSFREWNDKNVKALKQNILLFTAENRNKLNLFDEARNKGLFTRLMGLKKTGIHRQGLLDNLALFIGIIFNKI
ncbi:glycosyltransferase family 2 protein [Candidatus Trichorickettsia mobilis]|uniref:glycosyltransferase family 2 protein n=1 Tax=Candidatus Trichorickettsia mobilis TaxID=1346319 RepID=UPI00292E9812|nr:glycosyltransferase family 2 protein [Candidatus Trichorickettsia mobilis]